MGRELWADVLKDSEIVFYIKYQKFIKQNCKYVGDNFAQEVRTIHYDNKKDTRGIYGKVTAEEIDELNEEGIETTIIPWFDKSEN